MKIAFYSPVPPAKTGVAHYASMVIPALREHAELDVNPGNRRPATDNAIYQLGNNPHHEFVYREAVANPGVVVLHDIVLHHLIVEMTLARGDAEGYVEAMRANHGEMGAAWARGRIIGLHDEIANFLMPASIDVANRSRAVIVHNRWAAERLQSLGVRTPIHVVPHPHSPRIPNPESRIPNPVIGFFGFLTSAKRTEVVLEAFRMARSRDPRVTLLIVGEAAPNIRVPSGEGITVTGYAEDLDPYYDRVDRLVNLRYPSAGETSGTLIRAFEAGKPVAVSDYAQFAELPDDCVVKFRDSVKEKRNDDLSVDAIPPGKYPLTATRGSTTLRTDVDIQKGMVVTVEANFTANTIRVTDTRRRSRRLNVAEARDALTLLAVPPYWKSAIRGALPAGIYISYAIEVPANGVKVTMRVPSDDVGASLIRSVSKSTAFTDVLVPAAPRRDQNAWVVDFIFYFPQNR